MRELIMFSPLLIIMFLTYFVVILVGRVKLGRRLNSIIQFKCFFVIGIALFAILYIAEKSSFIATIAIVIAMIFQVFIHFYFSLMIRENGIVCDFYTLPYEQIKSVKMINNSKYNLESIIRKKDEDETHTLNLEPFKNDKIYYALKYNLRSDIITVKHVEKKTN